MENVFKEGETVYARAYPQVKLIIRRYVDKIYYCRVKEDSSQDERVYFERELTNLAKK